MSKSPLQLTKLSTLHTCRSKREYKKERVRQKKFEKMLYDFSNSSSNILSMLTAGIDPIKDVNSVQLYKWKLNSNSSNSSIDGALDL